MLSNPHPQIDHRTLKLIVGIISLTLPCLTSLFAHQTLTSISASYYATDLSRNIFIGYLFATSAFLFAYNGYTAVQMALSKIAAAAALCIALVPCNCGHPEGTSYVHYSAAAVMFTILAFFCYVFWRRALDNGHREARRRAVIYMLCCAAMIAAILALAYDGIVGTNIARFKYFGEATALLAFGISWLTASHWLPFITTKAERQW